MRCSLSPKAYIDDPRHFPHALFVAPMQEDLHRRMLVRAVRILGGEDALAEELNVSRTRLGLWLIGAERPPVSVFLQLVDLLLKPEAPQTQKESTSTAQKPLPETATPEVKSTL
jgi:hypothetical protein